MFYFSPRLNINYEFCLHSRDFTYTKTTKTNAKIVAIQIFSVLIILWKQFQLDWQTGEACRHFIVQ